MKLTKYMLCGLAALFIAGCGQSVKQTLNVPPGPQENLPAADKTVVILPFADYSYGDDITTAYRRSTSVSENLTDRLTAYGFHMPVNEDIFLYLTRHKIINPVSYEDVSGSNLEMVMQDEWSPQMQAMLSKYRDVERLSKSQKILGSPGTHGLTSQSLIKIGRHFGADYIVRGRILEYKTRQEHTWAPWKRGILPFVGGVSNQMLFGLAATEDYDNWNNMVTGGVLGASWANHHDPVWPFGNGQEILGIEGSAATNTIVWGAIGAELGQMAHRSGKVPQAVVQLRMWIQDAYSGDVVWTNRVDVKVSPETVFADYQYDALFQKATQKAIATLVDDFVDKSI